LPLEDNTDGGLGDVVDDTGLAVVDLVGHTLLDRTCLLMSPPLSTAFAWFLGFRTVGYDIDDITDLVLLEVGRERDHTLLLEVPRETVAASAIVAQASPGFPTYA
jgi:hypothetical protein